MVNSSLLLLVALVGAAPELQRDPTQPLSYQPQVSNMVASEKLPHLQSIVIGNGTPTALIDGKSYRIGDMVDSYQIIAIENRSVLLQKNGNNQRLTLFKNNVLR